MNNNYTVVDLYAGSGGVTQAFKNKGFNVLAAVEFNSSAAATYRANHPEVHLYEKDIREIHPLQILADCDLKPGELTVLSVCAPCQPFSRQNKSNKKDSRTKLVLQMIRFVKYLKPKLIFMENVSGLAKGRNSKILNSLIVTLRDGLGYYLAEPTILDAVNYGVPQHRERLFLIGSRERIPLGLPKQSHFPPKEANDIGKPQWVTVGDAFKDITRLSSGQQSSKDVLHRSRKHTALNIERLKHIPKNGGSRKSLPEQLQLECHKNGTGFNDVYGRLYIDRPSNTLTTGCTNFTKGRFAHPTANRAITPREAARLQTFPDSYIFKGTYDQISTQIGNAVPVKFAEAFADYFLTLPLDGNIERQNKYDGSNSSKKS